MRIRSTVAAAVVALAVAAVPALAAGPPADTPNRDGNSAAGPPANAKAYGYKCREQSRERSDAAPGTRGTPFSQCVIAMAKLASGAKKSPREACANLSKKHIEGQRGTPFSICVSAGARLLREQRT